ncbi:hypothetical protein TrVE_jg5422 [Triparma verrucosa]|uniref:Uncharacterized protein n=1 Tax=Triparma verrucosa TaxID=1606542 RepID=A0A9W7F622_9STRA|nr:hypothetical protein TrVE_jg5422 [Triparma verrucosa]
MEATLSKPQSSSTTTPSVTLTSSSSNSTERTQEEDLLARLAKLSDGIQTSQHHVQSLSSADEGSGGKPMNLEDLKNDKAECDNKKDQQAATAPAENSLIARIKAAQAAKEKKHSPPRPPPPPSALTAPAPALAPDLLSIPAPSVQEPPPPFPTHMVAPPHEAPPPSFDSFKPMAPALSPPKVNSTPAPSFEMVQSPPPPVFSTSTALPPPPSFEQFIGAMDPIQPASVSYPVLDLAPPKQQQQQQQQTYQPTYTSVESPTSSETLDMSESAIAQQREILSQIERSKSSKSSSSSSYPGAGATRQTTQTSEPLVTSHEVTPGNHVQLYSQEATKQAVAQGEAHVVKCISCNGWMQVINSATLVFCPTCQVISPVTEDNTMPLTSQHSTMISSTPGSIDVAPSTSQQTTDNDAALAAMLQAQFDEEETPSQQTTSQRRIMSDIMPGVTSSDQRAARNAHIASLSPSQRALHGLEVEGETLLPVNTGMEVGEGREVSSDGMLGCLKSGVESAGMVVGDIVRGFRGKKKEGGVVVTSYGGGEEGNYALLEDPEL